MKSLVMILILLIIEGVENTSSFVCALINFYFTMRSEKEGQLSLVKGCTTSMWNVKGEALPRLLSSSVVYRT